MESAKDAVRQTLTEVKTFLAQEAPPRITEADTKANFIEPIVAALGWTGIGIVTREYYVKNSQEFIDYVMRGQPGHSGQSGPLLAIESKALQSDLTDKAAAQLIQYCAVEGIEWAALTNGRELQFFNTFLKPDLAAKRILSLDLLAFNNEEEFDALFQQLWQLSRESMTTPTGVRTWLNQRRMDESLRGILTDPTSTVVRQLRKALADTDIRATPQDVVQWFRSHLGKPITVIPSTGGRAKPELTPGTTKTQPEKKTEHSGEGPFDPRSSVVFQGDHDRLLPLFEALVSVVASRVSSPEWRAAKYYLAAEYDNQTFIAVKRRAGVLKVGLTLPSNVSGPELSDNDRTFKWSRITKLATVAEPSDLTDGFLNWVEQAARHATEAVRGNVHHGVTLKDLLNANLLHAGERMWLYAGSHALAEATLLGTGEFEWQGKTYDALSDRTFAGLMGRKSLNGWTAWYVERNGQRQLLASIRETFQSLPSRTAGMDSANSAFKG